MGNYCNADIDHRLSRPYVRWPTKYKIYAMIINDITNKINKSLMKINI